ncbi:MAG: rod shape-determining protein MreC [Cytophagaceae bacterium]|nr:rod shape-determining protein MreC [Cytophagaceae bacterium]
MINLLRFLYDKRNFLFFVLLEVLCGWLIFTFNKYQGAFYFNSSNAIAGNALSANRSFTSYFDLEEQNDKLVRENIALHTLLEKEKKIRKIEALTVADSARRAAYDFVPARVIKNSLMDTKNFITIDKGTADGLTPNMGLIGPQGVVGQIKYCSEHYSTGSSILHVTNGGLSGRLSRSGAVGSLEWDGADPRFAKLKYIGKHYFIQPGDTVLTSGYNTRTNAGHSTGFPAGILIGVVETVNDDEQSNYNISVRLATDFGSLDHVYAIRSKAKPEIDSLEAKLDKPKK